MPLAIVLDVAGRSQTPRLRFDLVVRQNAERRNNVFREVFVLIVAPIRRKSGLKESSFSPHFPHTFQQRSAMQGRCALAFVLSEFFAHERRPGRGSLTSAGMFGSLK